MSGHHSHQVITLAEKIRESTLNRFSKDKGPVRLTHVEPLVVEVLADIARSGQSFRHPMRYLRPRPELSPDEVKLPAGPRGHRLRHFVVTDGEKAGTVGGYQGSREPEDLAPYLLPTEECGPDCHRGSRALIVPPGRYPLIKQVTPPGLPASYRAVDS